MVNYLVRRNIQLKYFSNHNVLLKRIFKMYERTWWHRSVIPESREVEAGKSKFKACVGYKESSTSVWAI